MINFIQQNSTNDDTMLNFTFYRDLEYFSKLSLETEDFKILSIKKLIFRNKLQFYIIPLSLQPNWIELVLNL